MQSRMVRTFLISLALTTLLIALPKDPAIARHPHDADRSRKANRNTCPPPDYKLRFDGIIELY